MVEDELNEDLEETEETTMDRIRRTAKKHTSLIVAVIGVIVGSVAAIVMERHNSEDADEEGEADDADV